jgi:hypothetical protein
MHSALQTFEQTPQPSQLDLSIFNLNIVNFEIRPKRVPTGQIVLQYNLPLL